MSASASAVQEAEMTEDLCFTDDAGLFEVDDAGLFEALSLIYAESTTPVGGSSSSAAAGVATSSSSAAAGVATSSSSAAAAEKCPVVVDLTGWEDEVDQQLRVPKPLDNRKRHQDENPEPRTFCNSDYLSKLECPVCLGTVKDLTSSLCGHLFCRACIVQAVTVTSKCPVCRAKMSLRSFHRVFS